MRERYILFDLDGTLTDPKEGITKSVKHALDWFGIPVTGLDSLVPFIGPPLRESFQVRCGLSPIDAETAVAKYREYFAERGIFENAVFPGVDEMLGGLRGQGKVLMLATSKPIVYAERILRHFGLDHHFAFAAGAELDGARSKKSELIRHALAAVPGASPGDAVMVGDRMHDIAGARETGLRSVGVLYGYGGREELSAAGADRLAASVPELARILARG